MEFVILKEKEFDEFAESYKYRCYLQSSIVAELRSRNGWKSHFVGVRDDDNIVAAALLLSKKRHFKYEFYAIRGPLLDFSNKELLRFFVDNLKKYVKSHNGYMLRIDPYIPARSLDKDGNFTGEFDNTIYKSNLIKLGFKETIAKEMNDTAQAKFMYMIDLGNNLDEVMKGMDSKTRQMIRKNEKNGVVIRTGTEDDISLFENIMDNTSERRNFHDRGIKFYKDMYDCLSKQKWISLVFAELDIDLAKQKINAERAEINKAREDRQLKVKEGKCNLEKANAKYKEEDETLQRLDKKENELTELEIKHGKRITLGGILYIIYKDEVASLFGGCYDEFLEYQPFYTIHYEMIKYAIQHKAKTYNFYAINNHWDKNADMYGIYQFKRGFGGHVVEFLGEFILPVNKLLYWMINVAQKLKKLLRMH